MDIVRIRHRSRRLDAGPPLVLQGWGNLRLTRCTLDGKHCHLLTPGGAEMSRRSLVGLTSGGGAVAAVVLVVVLATPVHAQRLALDGFDDVDGPIGWTAGTAVTPTNTPCVNMTTT